jgi:hypothetical protein
LSDDPADNNEEGRDTKSNLDAGADGNTHGKVHLVSEGDNNGGDVLSGVADDRNQDQTDKRLADVCALNNVIDTTDKVIGTNGYQNCCADQNHGSSDGTHASFFFVLSGFLGFGIEKVAVSSELEHEIEYVKKQQNDGGASRQDEDAATLVVGSVLGQDGIELKRGENK